MNEVEVEVSSQGRENVLIARRKTSTHPAALPFCCSDTPVRKIILVSPPVQSVYGQLTMQQCLNTTHHLG